MNSNNADAWKTNIQHVVVLMMENRSFDHLLGDFRRIDVRCDGVDRNNPVSNSVPGIAAPFMQAEETPDYFGLPLNPTFDPHHEFENVQRQLGGNFSNPAMTGFAGDAYECYKKQQGFAVPLSGLVQRVMNFIPFGATPEQDPLPAIQGLARAFTVCDKWFSSLPGPTWPNRFFAMMGSTHGRVLMPSQWTDALKGIANFCDQICKDSIFSLLAEHDFDARIYCDGGVAITYLVKGGSPIHGIGQFEQDVKSDDLPALAWIEPDYSSEGSDGNSQHPPEDLRYGDAFIARIYNTLRQYETVWNQTLLVILHDEHGGFFDHVVPPATVAPDNFKADVPASGLPFAFDRLGVRVPAILVSPWLAQDIDHTQYDHTSLLAFICDRFNLDRGRLGKRVLNAAHFGQQNIWLNEPRANAPLQLRKAKQPPRSRDLVQHETGLAADNRRMIQGLFAYIHGGDVLAAWSATAGPTRSIGAVNPPQRLSEMAEEIHQALLWSGDIKMRRATSQSRALTASQGSGQLRLLCLHGVGHGDASRGWQADPGWRDRWRDAIVASLAPSGVSADRVEIHWLAYDDLFGDGPSPLQLLSAVPLLLGALGTELGEELGLPAGRERAFGLDIPEMLRWTAGMTLQWIEDNRLRDRLCARLMKEIKEFDPHAILGHSLGSLIAYDAFRRAVVSGGEPLNTIDGRVFSSFGSQIAHPVVIREVWGGQIAGLYDEESGRGIATWFLLFNPYDRVFTRPIPGKDPRRLDIVADRDIPFRDDWLDLNHAGEAYLSHPAVRAAMWPAIAAQAGTTHAQGAAPEVRSLGLQTTTTLRRTSNARRALLVGINAYPDESARLQGCVNDVFAMSQMLQRSGYAASEIRLLLDERATRDEIVKRLDWLVDGARSGDERVFFYSGHGAQIPQYGAGGEPDHLDETLVPVDFDWNNPETYFTDKTFREFYSQLPFRATDGQPGSLGVNMTVILDCCHAGGMTRGAARIRGLNPPNDIRHRMLRWDDDASAWVPREWLEESTRRPYSDGDGSTRARRTLGASQVLRIADRARYRRQRKLYGHGGPFMPLLLYAAREQELASEYDHGALAYGAFTYALTEQLGKVMNSGLSFTDLVVQVARALQARHFAQHPEVVGPAAAKKRIVPWTLK